MLRKGLVTAVPLEEAIQKLKRKWAGFFTQTSTVADAGGQATRNTKLARVTLHRSAVQGIPDEQVSMWTEPRRQPAPTWVPLAFLSGHLLRLYWQ
jgi:hypothetical protein